MNTSTQTNGIAEPQVHLRTHDPKTPWPHEPLWACRLGPVAHEGKGLLAPALFPLRPGIDSFSVLLGTYAITVQPKLGRILFDSRVMLQTDPGELVWFRRMDYSLGTHDVNTGAAGCLFYGIGLESGGQRPGFKLFADGRAEPCDLR